MFLPYQHALHLHCIASFQCYQHVVPFSEVKLRCCYSTVAPAVPFLCTYILPRECGEALLIPLTRSLLALSESMYQQWSNMLGKQEGRSPLLSATQLQIRLQAEETSLLLPRYGSHITVEKFHAQLSKRSSFNGWQLHRGTIEAGRTFFLRLWRAAECSSAGLSSQLHVEHLASPVKQPRNNEIITCSPLCVLMYPWLYIFPMQRAPFTAQPTETQINKHGNQNQECIDLHFNPPCNFLCNKNLSVTHRAERASPSISFFQMQSSQLIITIIFKITWMRDFWAGGKAINGTLTPWTLCPKKTRLS